MNNLHSLRILLLIPTRNPPLYQLFYTLVSEYALFAFGLDIWFGPLPPMVPGFSPRAVQLRGRLVTGD